MSAREMNGEGVLENGRDQACALDHSASEPVHLASVWSALMQGTLRVVDVFVTSERSYLVTEARQDVGTALTPRRRLILEQLLLGRSQKALADELDLSVSTIAFSSSEALRELGLPCTASKAPLFLVLACHAWAHPDRAALGRCCVLSGPNSCQRVFSAERPDAQLARVLTPAEYSVVTLFIEGKSHAEIARHRRRSARTIANQLASAFQHLRASGRLELMSSIAGSRRSVGLEALAG